MKKYRTRWLIAILFIVWMIYDVYNNNYRYIDIDDYRYTSDYIISKERAKDIVITSDEQAIEVFYQEKEKFDNIANYILSNELEVGWEIFKSKKGVEIISLYYRDEVIKDETVKSDIIYLFEKYNIVYIESSTYTVSGLPYNEMKFNYSDSYDFLYTDNFEYAAVNDEYITPIEECWYLNFFPYYDYRSKYLKYDECTETSERDRKYIINNDEQAIEVFRKERDKFENISNYIISKEMNISWQVIESERGGEVLSSCDKIAFITDETVKADIIYLFEQYDICYIRSNLHNNAEVLYDEIEFSYSFSEDFLYTDNPEYAFYDDDYITTIADCWYLKFFPYGI